MFVTHFRSLLRFHFWARDRLVVGVQQLGAAQYTAAATGGWGSVAATLAHLAGAERIWLDRIHGSSASALLDERDLATLAAVQSYDQDTEQHWQRYLATLTEAELARGVAYTTTTGTPFVTSVADIITHVVNHATEHRAQIAMLLTAADIAHPGMDVILFVRESAATPV